MEINKIARIGLGIGLLWYGILRGAKSLVVRVSSWAFREIDFANNTISLYLNLAIKNPLLIGVTVKGIQGDVYIQGIKAGYINMSYDYFLGGGKTHVLPVIVNLDISGVSDAVVANIRTGDFKNITAAFDGKVIAGKYEIAIPLQFELDYKTMTA